MRLSKKGFTLIEIVIVLIIIAIFAQAAVVTMRDFRKRAVCSEAAMMLEVMRISLESYRSQYKQYPSHIDDWVVDILPQYLPGLNVNELTGTYFAKENFYVVCWPHPGVGDITYYAVSAREIHRIQNLQNILR